MTFIVRRRVFLETAQTLVKERRPTLAMIEAHRAAFEAVLADMVEPPVIVAFVETT